MKVQAKVVLPKEVEVEVTIRASLGDLLDLQVNRGGWSKLGEILLAAIRDAAANVRATAEAEVQKTPENT